MAPKNTCPPPPPSSATNGVRAHPFHARNLNVSGNTASIAERGADDLLPRGHPAAGAPRRLPLHGSLRDAVGNHEEEGAEEGTMKRKAPRSPCCWVVPSAMLSGFATPIANMPLFVQ